MGEIAHLYARSICRTTNLGNWRMGSASGFRLPTFGSPLATTSLALGAGARLASQLPFYDYESAAYFVHYLGEVNDQQRLLRVDDHVGGDRSRQPAEPNRFPQAPLHAVALHRAAEGAADGKSDARAGSRASCRVRLRPQQIERGQRRGKMPPPQFVHTLKIRVPQKPRVAGESLPGPRLDRWFQFSWFRSYGHTASHSDSKFPDRLQNLRYADKSVRATKCRATKMSEPQNVSAWTIRGNLVLPRPVYAPWRAGGK